MSMADEIAALCRDLAQREQKTHSEVVWRVRDRLNSAQYALRRRDYDTARANLREARELARLLDGMKPVRRQIKRWMHDLDYAIDDKEDGL